MSKDTLVGIFIGIIISYIFYIRTRKDTEADILERRRAEKAIILTRDPAYKAVFNQENKIKTITVDISANLHGKSKVSGNLSVHEKDQNDILKTNK
jgi:mannose/fructose/N-acetylgalactosamine-specific phosphotransferase system component IIB